MDEEFTAKEAGQVKKILEENLKLTKEIYKMTKSIKSFVLWQRIFGALKILIIVVPIVLGIIYLPAILEKAFTPYKELLDIEDVGGTGNILDLLKGRVGGQDLKDININKLPPEAQK